VGSFQFASSLVASLAWPVVVLVVVVYLRGEVKSVAQALAARVQDLKKLSAGAVSAEFEKGASDVARRSDAIAASDANLGAGLDMSQQVEAELDKRQEKIDRLIEQDPRAVVLLEFIEVESALGYLYETRFPDRQKTGFIKMVNELVKVGVLPANLAGVLRELAALRNELSHRPDTTVTEEAARNYAEAASQATFVMGGIADVGPEFDPPEVWGPAHRS
jgi:hypothetical protein